jgi:23S rRNA (cytosine1962-C5)-methyltransferase
MTLPSLYLKKDEQRRLRAGHLWIYSNEVDTDRSPLTAFTAGQQVTVRNSRGAAVGNAYVNPRALICGRLFSRDTASRLDPSLLTERLRAALTLRDTLFEQPCYRLAFSEGDGLPGLTVDRFGAVVVAQITTAGMEVCKGHIVDALTRLLRPAAVVMRNDTESRRLEGLDEYVEVAYGELPATVSLEENGARFEIDPLAGQKTGWFYDHRLNRARMQRYVRSKTVLDVFSYTGAWGVSAAVAGAREVMCMDSSAGALQRLSANAALNEVTAKVQVRVGDAFGELKALHGEARRFDVIILDPPAFIKRKKDVAAGTEAYQRLNHLALQLLADDGMLISSSCSYHMTAATFQSTLLKAVRPSGRALQLTEQGHQAPDHPVHPAMPENNYLKTLFMRTLAGRPFNW